MLGHRRKTKVSRNRISIRIRTLSAEALRFSDFNINAVSTSLASVKLSGERRAESVQLTGRQLERLIVKVLDDLKVSVFLHELECIPFWLERTGSLVPQLTFAYYLLGVSIVYGGFPQAFCSGSEPFPQIVQRG
mmetsp:Transcript_10011/g.42186  ORF Transcript_10011/g.42186 Transcript_10011/m.42186 type:complete len:134 (+) Transcript_10011:375-776(+)